MRDALLVLASTLPDSNRGFGTREQVDPVRHLILSASAWGGNPDSEAKYLNVFPEGERRIDGLPARGSRRRAGRRLLVDQRLHAQGYFEPNRLNAYTVNTITGTETADGKVVVPFGGCDGTASNCLPTVKGWNYFVRLYRPRAELLNVIGMRSTRFETS